MITSWCIFCTIMAASVFTHASHFLLASYQVFHCYPIFLLPSSSLPQYVCPVCDGRQTLMTSSSFLCFSLYLRIFLKIYTLCIYAIPLCFTSVVISVKRWCLKSRFVCLLVTEGMWCLGRYQAPSYTHIHTHIYIPLKISSTQLHTHTHSS